MKLLIALMMLPLALFAFVPGQDTDQSDSEADYDVEERLAELGITLDAPTPPTANYRRSVRSGNLVFLAGHGPDKQEGGQVHGTMGTGELTLEEGQQGARYTGISLFKSLKAEMGELMLVRRSV